MSFKAAIRSYLFSDAAVTAELSQAGTNAGVTVDGGGTAILIGVAGLSSAPDSRGKLLIKNAAGLYEFIDYTAVAVNGANYDFTINKDLINSYAIGNYVAMCVGIYSYPAPQSKALPYMTVDRVTTEEVLNKLDGAATVVMESWQVSIFADTDDKAESIKDDVVAALNIVNPTTWSDDGFANYYTVDTSIFITDATIPDLDVDGSQNAIIHKPLIFTIKRSLATTPIGV